MTFAKSDNLQQRTEKFGIGGLLNYRLKRNIKAFGKKLPSICTSKRISGGQLLICCQIINDGPSPSWYYLFFS